MERRIESVAAWALGGAGVILGGLGFFLFSEKGRSLLRSAVEHIWNAPDRIGAWNEAAQRELEAIQQTLNQLASTLESAR
jgi:hypothetical protein